MMRVVTFTCARHMQRAEISADHLSKLGFDPVLAVDVDDVPKFSGCRFHVEKTVFPRAGNLNGGRCLLGMLETMANAQGDSSCVLKVDSDIILADPCSLTSRVLDGANSLVGIAGSNGAMRGGAYALDAKKLLPILRSECLLRTSASYPEAALLERLVRFAGLRAFLHDAAMLSDYPLRRNSGRLPSTWHCGTASDVCDAMSSAMAEAVTRRHCGDI